MKIHKTDEEVFVIDQAASPLSHWESFYVIVGSSGAALIGLQFVVIALIPQVSAKSNSGSMSAFGTPTVFHLGAALLASAIMSSPWPRLEHVLVALLLVGVIGAAFVARTARTARQQTGYKPVLEDWIWHFIAPFVAYGAMGTAALTIPTHTEVALFVVGGAALSLLFIGIHNAWDSVTYIVLTRPEPGSPAAPPPRERQEHVAHKTRGKRK